uniref:Bifunctional inhibitor/plant lipid transfer protein/seed storage helical domain-containing protein n=1 Tax=Daucus carota subsp. sativus TaxID=79200 RepID=A0A175YNR4_DAUCS
MGSSGKIKTLILRVVFVIALTAIMSAEAQDVPTCASALVPCAVFLNATTKPPASCCDPLKDAVANQLECLCGNRTSPNVPASGSPRYNDSSSKNHAGRLTSAGIFSGLLIWASLTLF